MSAGGEFLPGDVRSHDFDPIAGLHILQVGHIHHHLIHRHATRHRAVRVVEVHACARVGEVVQIAVSEADADGGHTGMRRGDVSVVVGHAVVVRQRAHERDAAEQGESVASL